jgi:8-oxo-dGTP diphosphatase
MGAAQIVEAQFWVGVHGAIANRARILVLRRADCMSYKPGLWDLPGGHLALGESFENCLLREIKEETGLEVSVGRLLGIHKIESEPYLQTLYVCRLTIYRPIKLRPDEHVEARWVSAAELAQLETIPYLDAILKRGLLKGLID